MYQTMEEIEKQYDGHWVFMVNCKEGKPYSIAGGEVIAASKNKKQIIELWMEKHDSNTFFRYVGSIPDGMGVLL